MSWLQRTPKCCSHTILQPRAYFRVSAVYPKPKTLNLRVQDLEPILGSVNSVAGLGLDVLGPGKSLQTESQAVCTSS